MSLLIIFILSGCERFLDEKADRKMVIPTTLRDAQSLLDSYSNINNSFPGEGEVASDDYYLEDNAWESLANDADRRAYIWQTDYSITHQRWHLLYRNVYWANVVLECLTEIDRTQTNAGEWDNIKGQALFLRAKSLLSAVAIWSFAYDYSTAKTELGVPIRLEADYNINSHRSSLEETYQQILNDLEIAIDLLPVLSLSKLRASKPAALGLSARTYLFMRDYEKCLQYASDCLQINGYLLDYNRLNPSDAFPLPNFQSNDEILFHCTMASRPQLNINIARIDTNLYSSFEPDDLRKQLFFRNNSNGSVSFRGSYNNNSTLFFGITTSEVLLMRAESLARVGRVEEAIDDLNSLRVNRYTNGQYFQLKITDQNEALSLILSERRKELMFRGIRFPDLKRLNISGESLSLKRNIRNTLYILPPNDLRWALPIPEAVIERAPSITQNPY